MNLDSQCKIHQLYHPRATHVSWVSEYEAIRRWKTVERNVKREERALAIRSRFSLHKMYNLRSRLAWVDNHLADSSGIRSDEENPTCREDYTQNKTIVEVHPEPNDRSAKQKNEEISQHLMRTVPRGKKFLQWFSLIPGTVNQIIK